MAPTLAADATAGHEAGDGALALAAGQVSAGVLAVVTGAEPQPGNGVVAEVSFSVDDTGASPNPNEIGAAHTFTVTQDTTLPAGVGAAVPGLAVQSTQQGFTLTTTGTLAANTMYLFGWTG
jgi:hypothetical protein